VLFAAIPGVIPDPGDTGLGQTTLFWNAPGYSNLEVHVDAPNGPLLSGPVGSVGTASTGEWVADGMRFYLWDPSSQQTIGIVTVDLQPATQHYVAFYTAEGGVTIFSRESGHRLGGTLPSTFPIGVTPIDLHTSPDGTLTYMMGSDFNYWILPQTSWWPHLASAASPRLHLAPRHLPLRKALPARTYSLLPLTLRATFQSSTQPCIQWPQASIADARGS
jgi:hypothetical protein